MAALWPSGCTCTGAESVASSEPPQPLVVSEVQPPEGNAAGGPFATVLGEGFDPRAPIEVHFGQAASPRTAVISGERLQVEIPPGEAGRTVTVRVRQGSRQATLERAFRYRAAHPAHGDEGRGDGDR